MHATAKIRFSEFAEQDETTAKRDFGTTGSRRMPSTTMNWLKRFLGIKTYIYSDPFLVNDSHLTARYYQIVRCVETNQIDFIRVKRSPEIGLESAMLPLGENFCPPATVSAFRNSEPDRITPIFPMDRAA